MLRLLTLCLLLTAPCSLSAQQGIKNARLAGTDNQLGSGASLNVESTATVKYKSGSVFHWVNGALVEGDAAAFRSAIGAGTSSFSGAYTDLSGKPTLGTLAAQNSVTASQISDATTYTRSFLAAVDASAARTALGLTIGTNVQAYDADLAAIAGLTSAADRVPYFTGSGTASLATFTSLGRSIAALSGGTSSQYIRGDGTLQTLNQASVSGLTTSSTPTFQGLNLFRTGANADAQIITTTSGRAGLTIEGFGTGTSLGNVGHPGAILALRERTGTANYFSLIYGQDASGSNIAGLAFVTVDDATNKGNVAVLTRAASGNLGLAATFDEDDLTVGGNVTATAFSGSGASLTSLNASNLASGTVPDARLRTALYSRGKAVYVDSVNGNDGTGARGRVDLPFLTLTAAKTAAASGDTIVVGPGAYTVSANLAKNGVNWHFSAGATVTRGAGDSGINQGIFDDRDTYGAGEAVVFTVTGAGVFVTGNFASVVALYKTGSRLSFSADSIQSEATSFDVSGAAECAASVRSISSPSCGVGSGVLSISCDYFAGTMSAASGGVINITADEIEGAFGPVVQSGDGEINIRARKVGICYTSAGAAVLNVVAESVAGVEMSGGQVSVKALTVGYVYADDADTHAYVDANEIRGNLTAGGINAAVHVLDAGSISSISVRIVNARISNSNTGAGYYPVSLDTSVSAGLKMQGVTLVASSAVSESIAATTGSKAKIYGVVSNKAVSANLTQQVGTVTVDANVD